MSQPQLVLGRDPDCDVVLASPSVSGRHARLAWQSGQLFVEDLGSANGTWVQGERVTRAAVKAGADVRLSDVALPWSDPKVVALVKVGASHKTIVAMPRFGRYVCPRCKTSQVVPAGFVRGELVCPSCREALSFGETNTASRFVRGLVSSLVAALATTALAVVVVLFVWPERLATAPDPLGEIARRRMGPRVVTPAEASSPIAELLAPLGPAVGSPEEAAVRAHSAEEIRAAIDSADPTTRNLAVQVASTDDGPFRVEQVARIWKHVRLAWRYVNDPRGGDYYARASETIANDFAGDCDDFAIVIAAMVEAIGGRARIVIMDGPEGGHAYPEVCIDGPPNEVSQKIARFYRRSWDRRLGARPTQTRIHYRSDASCPVWLNLDWTTNVIGGPYSEERFAVAVYSDGTTETLAPFRPEGESGPANTTLPQRRPLDE
ncbi:MAG: hypothetical protein OHK0013_02300 [Sandaracinaceae bacterium]